MKSPDFHDVRIPLPSTDRFPLFTAVSGGAFLHSGVLVGLQRTNFLENTAGEDGLAIMSLGIAENFTDVTFAANKFYCPAGEYGHDVDQWDDEVNTSHTKEKWRDLPFVAVGSQSGGQQEAEAA